MMAALQHGLPEAALRLAAYTEARAPVGVEARPLHEDNFDWPVVADSLLDDIQRR